MYNERKENFTIKDVILQILFVALFIFLLIWLFPTKSFLNKKVDPLLDTIFNTNIMTMKDAAKDYYTTPRLPQKVGDKVKLTLGEMLDKKLLIEFTDKYGQTCDINGSYVEITKYDDEYVMKVNLRCSKQEDYILVHMGCYDYCETTICENKDKDITDGNGKPVPTTVPTTKPTTTPTITPTTTPTVTPTTSPDPEKHYCAIVNNKYYGASGNEVNQITYEHECHQYRYVKVIKESCTDYGNWSDWQEQEVFNNDLTEVQTKVVKDTVTEQVFKGYRKVTYLDKNSPIKEIRKVFDGYEYKTECTNWKTEYEHTGVYKYSDWAFARYEKYSVPPKDTDTVRYTYDAGQTVSCGDCSAGLYAIYKVETRTRAEIVNEKQVCTNWEQKKVEKYKEIEVIIGYEEKYYYEKVYETVTKEVEKTLYRYRTRTCTPGSTVYQWSYYDDKSLIAQGYNMTGEHKEKDKK